MFEYLKLKAPKAAPVPSSEKRGEPVLSESDAIDRTAKLFIGGKQARPDGGYSRAVLSPLRLQRYITSS